ncbi:MAG: cupredoxin domain-containing protein [Thermoleophilia bacterium]
MGTKYGSNEKKEGDRESRQPQRGRRPRALSILIPALLAVLVAVVGCAESGIATQTTESAAGGGDVQVAMVDMGFEPETVTLPVGGSITWVNQDSASHNAVADDGSWATELFGGGNSATLTFDTPGAYAYVCTLHPNMTGTVIVE